MKKRSGLNNEEKDFIGGVGEWFYGTKPHTVNGEVGEVLAIMLGAARDVSGDLSLLPAPTMSVPGVDWLLAYDLQLAFRCHSVGADNDGVKNIAEEYATRYCLAQLGH